MPCRAWLSGAEPSMRWNRKGSRGPSIEPCQRAAQCRVRPTQVKPDRQYSPFCILRKWGVSSRAYQGEPDRAVPCPAELAEPSSRGAWVTHTTAQRPPVGSRYSTAGVNTVGRVVSSTGRSCHGATKSRRQTRPCRVCRPGPSQTGTFPLCTLRKWGVLSRVSLGEHTVLGRVWLRGPEPG